MTPLPSDPLPAEEIFAGHEPGIRYYLLLKQLPRLPEGVSNRPYIQEMDRILSGLYDIQVRAARLEAQGKTEQAAELYLQLVEARLDDPHSYFRLCKIYREQQKPEHACRVCKAYLEMVASLNDLGYRQPYRDDLAEAFRDMMQEYAGG